MAIFYRGDFMTSIQSLLYTVPAALIAISFHEFAHGFVSYKLGDPTPKAMGRLSLNPLAHLDFMGTLCLIFFHFGWAKPVGVNPYYYKNPKKGMVLVGLAGPVMNFILAFLCALIMEIMVKVTGGHVYSNIPVIIFNFLNMCYIINLGLGIFNLIPFPPLDGSKILGGLLPDDIYFGIMKYERYGQLILFGLLFLGVLDTPLNMLNNGISNVIWSIVEFII